jgi:hypothetical protein
MSDADTLLGSNLEASAPPPPAPPPPPEAAAPTYVMAAGEQFNRDQYIAAGWTDEQLLQAGRMTVLELLAPFEGIDLAKPLGMPESTWVILDDNDDIPPTGLFVGHNGTGFLIQTGIPVNVPNHVLQILDDAVMDAPIINPADRKVMGYRPRPRYTYRRVSAPADA